MFYAITRYLILPISFLILLFPLSSKAVNIPPYYKAVAEYYEVPGNLFYAIALQESRYKKVQRPWPWTLNVCGKGLYFDSKEKASIALKVAIDNKCSVDIGIFQIHWQSHSARFSSPFEALEPIKNMQVGAQILREQYKITNDWFLATGRYHSPGNKRLASNYRKSVYLILKKVNQ
jgi:soluble lytic murein transglycosylase-like protein